jgi:hypothetical protein
LYATPYHSDGVVHHTPDDAIKDDEHFDVYAAQER